LPGKNEIHILSETLTWPEGKCSMPKSNLYRSY